MIRQPVVGRVDFVHRTFQEYLAAKEAAEDHLVDVLLRRADSDQWRETIVMAAGHATPKHRAALLSGLLVAANCKPSQARRLRLLATACLEAGHTVDPTVAAEVDAALSTLLPPRSTRESRSLALAGDRVLSKLPSSLDGLSDAAAAACVRTAALINGPAALRNLAGYASDPRDQVQLELASMWRYFDAETYARTVLVNAPLCDGWITVRRREHVPFTHLLTRLRSLWIGLDGTGVSDLHWLDNAPHLHYLSCNHDRPLEDLAPLLEHPNLTNICLDGPGVLADLRSLAALDKLTGLWVGLGSANSIDFVAELPALLHLDLQHLRHVVDLSPLSAARTLTRLGLNNFSADATPIVLSLRHLTELLLFNGPLSQGLLGLRRLLPQLTSLSLIGVPIGDMSVLADAVHLRQINLHHSDIADLRPLAHLPELRWIYLTGSETELDLSPLAEMPRRAKIHIGRRQEVRGLDIVRRRHTVKRR